MVNRTVYILFIAFSILFAPSLSCSCIRNPNDAIELICADTNLVLIEVINGPIQVQNLYQYTAKINIVFKGTTFCIGDKINISTPLNSGICGVLLAIGHQYLINFNSNYQMATLCNTAAWDNVDYTQKEVLMKLLKGQLTISCDTACSRSTCFNVCERCTSNQDCVPDYCNCNATCSCKSNAPVVNCFVDPCASLQCGIGTQCMSDYCGGCNARCVCPNGLPSQICIADPCNSIDCPIGKACQTDYCNQCEGKCV